MIGKCNTGGGKAGGLYVWKKLSSQGGIFIEYVVSDNPNKYPNDGEQGGYLYEIVEDVTPEVTAQTPVITQILEGLVGKAQGANATADKILEGYSAYVGQELVEGTAKKGVDLALFGCTKYAVDKFTPTSNMVSTGVRVTHSLGEQPFLWVLIAENPVDTQNHIHYAVGVSEYGYSDRSKNLQFLVYKSSAELKYGYWDDDREQTATYIELGFSNKAYVTAGVEYTLITMA